MDAKEKVKIEIDCSPRISRKEYFETREPAGPEFDDDPEFDWEEWLDQQGSIDDNEVLEF